MGLTVKRKDDLSASFGKFAEMDPIDNQRDKFLKRDDKNNKKKPDKKKKHSFFGRKK